MTGFQWLTKRFTSLRKSFDNGVVRKRIFIDLKTIIDEGILLLAEMPDDGAPIVHNTRLRLESALMKAQRNRENDGRSVEHAIRLFRIVMKERGIET